MRLRNRDTNCRALCPLAKPDSRPPQSRMRPLSGSSANVCFCEGFRMTAHHDDAAGAGAVVRKPPVKETAIGGTCGGAAGFELSGLDRCRRDPPAQLLRYGTKIAIGRKRLWHPV